MENESFEFYKGQIINSDKFKRIEKDILKSLLKDDRLYSLEECKSIVKEFMEKEVK